MSCVSHWPRHLLQALVRFYRLFFRAWLGSRCRFEPTCSIYALEALERHGAVGGSYLTLRRLVRCQPACPGGHDPVPGHWRRPFTSIIDPTEKKPS